MTSFKVFYTDPSQSGSVWGQHWATRQEVDNAKSKLVAAGMTDVTVGTVVQVKMKMREDGLVEHIIDKKYKKNLKVGDKYLVDGKRVIFFDKEEEIL